MTNTRHLHITFIANTGFMHTELIGFLKPFTVMYQLRQGGISENMLSKEEILLAEEGVRLGVLSEDSFIFYMTKQNVDDFLMLSAELEVDAEESVDYTEVDDLNNDGEYSISEYLAAESFSISRLLDSERSRMYKAMVCAAKRDRAKRMEETSVGVDQNIWLAVSDMWARALRSIKRGEPFGSGGVLKFEKGGIAVGNSHSKGGIPITVKSTGQKIEIEGAEGVVNKKSMQSKSQVEFNGRKMTPCEAVSRINQMEGGVKFKCEDVHNIIKKDGSF